MIGTPEEKPHEREMEAQERAEAKKERKAALDKAKREGNPRLARTPGWPRCYFAGSTCASKTRWCVRAWGGWMDGSWGWGWAWWTRFAVC